MDAFYYGPSFSPIVKSNPQWMTMKGRSGRRPASLRYEQRMLQQICWLVNYTVGRAVYTQCISFPMCKIFEDA